MRERVGAQQLRPQVGGQGGQVLQEYPYAGERVIHPDIVEENPVRVRDAPVTRLLRQLRAAV